MSRLTPGKLNGLRRLAGPRGIFAITAMDQRQSLRVLVAPEAPGAVPDRRLVETKLDLASALSPGSTAVLLDPDFGVPHAIAAGALAPGVGLLVTLEGDGWQATADGGRVATVPEGWGVGPIRRLGADAVKLLVRFRPDCPEAAARNRALVERTAAECREHDIALVVESLCYPLPAEDARAFAAKKPELVVETARQLSGLGADLYKAEFPGDLASGDAEDRLLGHCRELDAACAVPWVLLSAGAPMDLFARMVELGCRAGASGFLAGRAIWQSCVAIADQAERRRCLADTAVANLARVTALAERLATPWTTRRGVELPDPLDYSPAWYRR